MRDRLVPVFEAESKGLFHDCWAARNAYVELLLDRSPERVAAFLAHHSPLESIDAAARTKMLRLLEIQRHAMLMYTSCGWFFNEVTGIETLQILQYALRALHLTEALKGQDWEPEFRRNLENIESNTHPNAALAYVEKVVPAKVGLLRVAMHCAAAGLFAEEPEKLELFTYQVKSKDFRRLRAGTQRLAIGRSTIKNLVTTSKSTFAFACVYLGQQTLLGVITDKPLPTDYNSIAQELERRFRGGDLAFLLQGFRQFFGEETFSLWHLLHDEKKKILHQITQQSLDLAAKNFSDIYYDNYQLMSSMLENDIALPPPYRSALAFTLRRRTLELLATFPLNPPRMARIIADCLHWNHEWDDTTADELKKAGGERVYFELLAGLEDQPSRLVHALNILRFLRQIGIKPNLWRSQNIFVRALKNQPERLLLGLPGDELADLCRELNVAYQTQEVMVGQLP